MKNVRCTYIHVMCENRCWFKHESRPQAPPSQAKLWKPAICDVTLPSQTACLNQAFLVPVPLNDGVKVPIFKI